MYAKLLAVKSDCPVDFRKKSKSNEFVATTLFSIADSFLNTAD